MFAGCVAHAPQPQRFSAVDDSVSTTYFPYDARDAQYNGPGHFTCAQLNGETRFFIAPSDTFGDERIWSGAPCPWSRWSQYPDCASVAKTCGVKVKLTCAANCRAGAPSVVAIITDYCPVNHPQNRQNGNCQGGPHFDIGKPIWEMLHDRNDNIRVRYEVVPQSTPLGAQWQSSAP